MFRFALFGAGRIGRVHARNLNEHSRARLASVFDVDSKAAQALAERFQAHVASDPAEAVELADAVTIASSTDTHAELIEFCAQAGKAIFCEKPIALQLERVDRCWQIAANCGVPIQIGFNRRYDPTHRAVYDAIRSGQIGSLEMLLISSRDPAPPPPDYVRSSGGLFRDMMIHDFDMARFLLGAEPVEVSARASVLVDPSIGALGDVDTAMVTLKTPDGVLCHINNSRRCSYGYDQRIEAFGSEGMVQSANQPQTALLRYSAHMTQAQDPLLDFFVERYADSYRAELDDFIQTLERDQTPSTTFEDGRRALLLAESALESLASGRVVQIPEG